MATASSPSGSARGAAPDMPAKICRTASARDDFKPRSIDNTNLTVVVLGASGDLAKKKTYPALFALFSKRFLPYRINILGYARSALTSEELRDRLRPYLKGSEETVWQFLNNCSYIHGEYNTDEGYIRLANEIKEWESDMGRRPVVGRLMYLALPPSVYPEVVPLLKRHCTELGPDKSPASWFRVIMEKPFGHDLSSSEVLAEQIGAHLPEEQVYRIDHYLGKELVQNMLVLRFANNIFNAWWNRHYISNIQIMFKEPFGTEGRGGYFDQYGIIRDVMQNHLAQVLALLTMEPPVSLHPDDIRDEKVKVLRSMPPVKPEDCILGQYTAANGQPGYLDDPTVPKDSVTPTYAAVRMYVNNERWAGVPIIMRAGKALNERLAAVRIQLKTPAASLFGDLTEMRNELVIKFQPGEAIYAKMVVKTPGLDMDYEMSELDLTYPERYQHIDIPDAYERLILDCIRGDQQHFVRRDELRAAWAIFTPLLHALEHREMEVEKYPYGSRGPTAKLDQWLADTGFVKTKYAWKSHSPRQSGTGTQPGSK